MTATLSSCPGKHSHPCPALQQGGILLVCGALGFNMPQHGQSCLMVTDQLGFPSTRARSDSFPSSLVRAAVFHAGGRWGCSLQSHLSAAVFFLSIHYFPLESISILSMLHCSLSMAFSPLSMAVVCRHCVGASNWIGRLGPCLIQYHFTEGISTLLTWLAGSDRSSGDQFIGSSLDAINRPLECLIPVLQRCRGTGRVDRGAAAADSPR